MTAFVILLIVVVVAGVAGVFFYNTLVKLRNRVAEAWAQISVQLKRRHDLIPPLVATVKGYAAHESKTLDAVVTARNSAIESAQDPAHADQAGKAELALSGALGNLFALAESYPDLKANTNFLDLQQQIVDTENRIAFSRQYYNDTVREWNTKIESIPYNFFAARMDARKAQYFEIQDIEHARMSEAISPEDTTKPPSVEF
jgi:LemA protein